MKTISLHQPWATLLAHGLKICETRAWPIRHRGPVLIHAAKRWTPEQAELCTGVLFRKTLEGVGVVFTPTEEAARAGWNLPLGKIVGRVDVTDCFATADVRAGVFKMGVMTGDGARRLITNIREQAFGDFSPGRFAWLCANARAFAVPAPCVGRQGFFDAPDPESESAPTYADIVAASDGHAKPPKARRCTPADATPDLFSEAP